MFNYRILTRSLLVEGKPWFSRFKSVTSSIRVGIFYTKTKKYADKFHITKVKVRKIDLRFDLHLTVT